jgi:hypothetical protein
VADGWARTDDFTVEGGRFTIILPGFAGSDLREARAAAASAAAESRKPMKAIPTEGGGGLEACGNVRGLSSSSSSPMRAPATALADDAPGDGGCSPLGGAQSGGREDDDRVTANGRGCVREPIP